MKVSITTFSVAGGNALGCNRLREKTVQRYFKLLVRKGRKTDQGYANWKRWLCVSAERLDNSYTLTPMPTFFLYSIIIVYLVSVLHHGFSIFSYITFQNQYSEALHVILRDILTQKKNDRNNE